MNISQFTAGYRDYELSLDYYHGKDIVHKGNLLRLDPTYSWTKLSQKVKNKISKAKKNNDIKIERVEGTKSNMKLFRAIWFDPNDPTLPEVLNNNEIMYLAWLKKELIGGLILSPSGKNLYMHNLGANEIGKKNAITSLLLWHAVCDLKEGAYENIDIGVSFRKNLYDFFKNWQTDSYPIIFEPPFIKPSIKLTPFNNDNLEIYDDKQESNINSEILNKTFSDKHTFFPRAIYALKALMIHLNVKHEENIAVYKTFANGYISRCVTDTINCYGKVSRKIDSKTKAVMVIHEFGYPCKELINIKNECDRNNIPLIENCAWGIKSKLNDNVMIGSMGKYAIYSLPKIFPMQYGSVLTGLTVTDEENWSKYGLLDYYKREIVKAALQKYLPQIKEFGLLKRNNWVTLARIFRSNGYSIISNLESDVYPSAILVKTNSQEEMNVLYSRYISFGVEVGRYYHENALFFPIHQNLTEKDIIYIQAILQGYLNLCSNYKRSG